MFIVYQSIDATTGLKTVRIGDRLENIYLSADMFINQDYDLIEAHATSLPLYEVPEDLSTLHTFVVGDVTSSCIPVAHSRTLQIGRSIQNDIHTQRSGKLPRFSMRLCLNENTDCITVKAAGYMTAPNGSRSIFLPRTCVLIGPGNYSTTNPVLYIMPEVYEKYSVAPGLELKMYEKNEIIIGTKGMSNNNLNYNESSKSKAQMYMCGDIMVFIEKV
jgi:hypothetical protein